MKQNAIRNETRCATTIDFLVVIVVAVYALHLTRNVSYVFAVIPWVACAITIAFAWRHGCIKPTSKHGVMALLFFLASMLYVALLSVFTLTLPEFVSSFLRFVYFVPFAVTVALVVDNPRRLKLAFVTVSAAIVLAAISLVYQEFFGAISWFTDPSARQYAIRYGSLVGSLTSYGTVVGAALVIAGLLIESALAVAILIVGATLSMQKAAMANVIVALAILISTNIASRTTVLLRGLVLAAAIAVAIAAAPVSREKIPLHPLAQETYDVDAKAKTSAVQGTFENLFVPSGDRNIFGAISDRLWSLPSVQLEKYGIVGMMTGVGFVGASGSLGYPHYPMAHNMFFEFLAMGGIFHLSAFIVVLSTAGRNIVRKAVNLRNSPGDRDLTALTACLAAVMFLVVMNSFFTSGLLVQPYMAMLAVLALVPITVRPDQVIPSNDGKGAQG